MDSIWLVLLLPLAGSLICATHYRALGKTGTGLAACLAILGAFLAASEAAFRVSIQGGYINSLGPWLQIPGISGLDLAALVDPLSSTMLTMITGVAFLIHCYSMGYMSDEEDYGRFVASQDLFVATMVLLVLSANLGLMVVGWGGVGYASYSLIGFYRNKPSAVSAARKAFLINVVGDVGIMLAIFIIALRLGALDFDTFLQPSRLAGLGPWVMICGACLLVGAYAKSAQLPFHTWLPDAMEGPTPVSALIHAATMVTAGVYLVVRCAPLLSYGPDGAQLMSGIALAGAFTALLGACAALVQNDLKRILAYSTMSQLGYMFMAAGVGASGAAIFHLITHAFFKALLFLTAGVVIHAAHGEQDIRKLGGLAKPLPGAMIAFAIGSVALAGLPPLSGFASKEAILMATYHSSLVEASMLWGVGIVTALLTAFYTGRAFSLVFLAPAQPASHNVHLPGSSMMWPLVVLSLLALVAGLWSDPIQLSVQHHLEHHGMGGPAIMAIAVALVGILSGVSLHRAGTANAVPASMHTLLKGCETLDGLSKVLAGFFRRAADALARQVDPVFTTLVPEVLRRSMVNTSSVLCQLQGGSLRLYATAILAALSVLVLLLFLHFALSAGAVGGELK